MPKYIAYIESPLQAFNLIEFIDSKDICLDYLIVNKKTDLSDKNFSQMSFMFDLIRFKKLLIIDIPGKKRDIPKIKRELSKTELSSKDICIFISGEYRARIFWMLVNLACRYEVFILDDGTATLRIDRLRQGFKQRLKSIFMKVIGSCDSFSEPVTFFSVYDIQSKLSVKDKLERHSYTTFRLKTSKYIEDNNTIYIIGTPLFEAGVVPSDDIGLTIGMLKDLKGQYPDRTLLYIPHRRERKEKITKILDSNYANIMELDFPFELFPIVFNKKVKFIAGYYSSLFDNLVKIYDEDISIISYLLPKDVISSEWVGFVQNIYSNYSSYKSKSFIFKKQKR